MYDLIIIGGGPGGVAAGVYAGRKLLKALLITESFGGQSLNSNDIQNWIGTLAITGSELAKRLEEHVRVQESLEIKEYSRVSHIEKVNVPEYALPVWDVSVGDSVYRSKAVIVTSGGRRRKLEVPGEKEFEGRGVVYCSTCDAPLFKDKDVVVVGAGNAAMEAVVDVVSYARNVTLLIRGTVFKCDTVTKQKILDFERDGRISVIFQAETTEIIGDVFVTGIKYLDKEHNREKELAVQGVFVEIGSIPNSDFVKGLVDMDEHGHIIIDHRTGETSQQGIFAAGAVANQLYDQNNISVGDAIKATLTANNYIVHFK